MKRFPAYDPAEYLDWKPEPRVMDDYRRRLDDVQGLRSTVQSLGAEGIERLYKGLVRNRLYDVTLKRWVRTGVITKAWLGQGEEATTVGAVHALAAADVVGPMIRNAAACFEKGIPLADCLKVYLATGDTVTKGRDLHIGDLRHGVICPVSLVGDLVPVMAGFALAFRARREDRVALTWVGDGATRTAACHEGLAVAASEGAPLIVVVQDNGVALGTECGERLRESLLALHEAYGARGLACDGNHVFEVLHQVRAARALCATGDGPVIVYAKTFRMGGHATHDEREARALFDAKTFREWGARDPIACMEDFVAGPGGPLGKDGRRLLARWEEEVGAEIDAAERAALAARESAPPDPRPESMLADVYAAPAAHTLR